MSLRAWARRDGIARAVVDEVDGHRIAFIEQIFTEIGHNPEQSSDLAHLAYACILSQALLFPNLSDKVKGARIKRLTSRLLQSRLIQ